MGGLYRRRKYYSNAQQCRAIGNKSRDPCIAKAANQAIVLRGGNV